jgi:FKBP-type peptidyl-prolyl cis-trans isomerase FkpA
MKMTTSSRRMALAAIVAIPALFSFCSLDVPFNGLTSIETTNFASSLGVDLDASTRTTNGAYFRDIVAGTGAVIAGGDQVSVHYTGWLSNGTTIDNSHSSGATFDFQFTPGQVIAGWIEGMAGMKVGGQRQLVIPPWLAYGEGGTGVIPPNAVLVFNIELVAVQK